jgi:WD40 repeat protein
MVQVTNIKIILFQLLIQKPIKLQIIDTGKSLAIKVSIDGKYCLVSNSTEGTISVYDRKQNKLIT